MPIRLPLGLLLFLSVVVLSSGQSVAGDFFLQAGIGAARFEADSLTFALADDPDTEEEDLSEMPYVGLFGQYYFSGRATQIGWEGGILYGWRSRETTVRTGPERTVVSIDTSLWILDLSAGLCLNQRLGDRWRFYIAGGPAMVFAEHEEERDSDPEATPVEEEDSGGESESEFGIGAYARLGLEYEMSPTAFVGVGVRQLATTLSFDSSVDSDELRGTQGYMTFTRQFVGY